MQRIRWSRVCRVWLRRYRATVDHDKRREMEAAVEKLEADEARQRRLAEKREWRRLRALQPSYLTKAEAEAIVDTLTSKEYAAFARLTRGDDNVATGLSDAINVILRDGGYRKRSNDVWFDRNYALWYAANRVAPSTCILRRILKETKKMLPEWTPASVLDFNGKFQSTLYAATDVWGDQIKSYTCLETNNIFRAMGEQLLYEYRSRDDEFKEPPNIVCESAFNDDRLHESDLVVCAYSLGDVDASNVLARLWKKTKGILVIVESGQKEGNEIVQNAREFLLRKYASHSVPESQRLHILSPCPHHDACPLNAKGAICSFGHRMARNTFPHRSPQKEWVVKNPNIGDAIIERFTYLVVQRGAPQSPYDIGTLAQRPSPPPTEQVHNWNRVLSPPVHKKRAISFSLCRPNGNVETKDVGKNAYRIPGAYKLAKKVKWGDLWHIPTPGDDEYIAIRDALRGNSVDKHLLNDNDGDADSNENK